jgi:hypothetical protein
MSQELESYLLARSVAAALPVPRLRSVYLIGSLARGTFAPGISDIDLLAFADGARTATLELRMRRPVGGRGPWTPAEPDFGSGHDSTLISLCIRPVEHLYDPFGPLRWSGRREHRNHKELTAVSDAMFLCDHGALLHGAELRPLCVLPPQDQYCDYLHWEADLAAHGPLRLRIADNPRRAAKRIAILLRDALFLHRGRVSSRPADLLEFVRPSVDDDTYAAVMAALWLSSLSSHQDYGSPLASRAIDRVMTHRERVFTACSNLADERREALPRRWLQLADLRTETFELCGAGPVFATARPIVHL